MSTRAIVPPCSPGICSTSPTRVGVKPLTRAHHGDFDGAAHLAGQAFRFRRFGVGDMALLFFLDHIGRRALFQFQISCSSVALMANAP